MESYLEYPLKFWLRPPTRQEWPKDIAYDPALDARMEESTTVAWVIFKGLRRISEMFGLSPPSQPVFVDFWDAPWVRSVQKENPWPRSWIKSRFDLSHDNYGWTRRTDPDKHYILMGERSRWDHAKWEPRSREKMYRTAIHEFGHRLQLTGLVDWPFDLQDGVCSTEVRRFAEHVAKRSAGDHVRLWANRRELRNREPDYGDLVSQCRRKQGLPR